MERYEHLADRARETVVHREALARPVAGCPKPPQLPDDRPARLGFPGPHLVKKLLPPEDSPIGLLTLGKLALHHHLRGDTGMVRARLPQHVATAHALVAAEDVLQRVVECMPHVEHAGDVGRRNDDGERRRIGAVRPPGLEGLSVFPNGRDPCLDGGRIEGLFHGSAGVRWLQVIAAALQSGPANTSQRGRRPVASRCRAGSLDQPAPTCVAAVAVSDRRVRPARSRHAPCAPPCSADCRQARFLAGAGSSRAPSREVLRNCPPAGSPQAR